jgi:hypothetical protein
MGTYRSGTMSPSSGNMNNNGTSTYGSGMNNQAYAFQVGTGSSAKVYLVFNRDGSLANNQLAAYAGRNDVSIKGTVSMINGLNVITIDQITPNK